ncbi:hypothetical protein M2650_07265 [Luteimonas sp. SX5]|uniref:DUF3619 family protein n=1 Tax=Luteimonas galliterrae TaxID=2940486 RepID=A0ABT0MHT6_9GAMM|nr:hypothetical protein [Luteimonas galliterrae]MCL1634430.1 hypothetical protein [Luteimonas galliterrae]
MSDIRNKEDAFDAAMRERYRVAAGSTSVATRARLRQARHAAAAGETRRHGFSWPLLFGGAAAAVFAIAFGLGLRKEAALPAPEIAASAASAADDYETASALEQDPDFYAWLGSPDAELVAVE